MALQNAHGIGWRSQPSVAGYNHEDGGALHANLSGRALAGLVAIVLVPMTLQLLLYKCNINVLKSGLAPLLPILGACALFCIVGPALMMLNKHIMDDLEFRYPVSLCSLGVFSSTVLSRLAVLLKLGEVRQESLSMVSDWSSWFRIAGLMGLMKALTMSTGNAVYLHLSFGFIQMLKAFVPLIVLMVMKLFRVNLPTRAAVWCVGAIISGTLIEVRGELHFSVFGVLLMLSSETCEAVSVVLSQKILQNFKFTVLEGMYITSPATGMFLAVAVCTLELPVIVQKGHHLIPLRYPVTFITAGMLGFFITMTSFVVTRLTSALTMKVLNTGRSVGLVVVGILFYGEVHPLHQLAGYAVALTGFAGYNFFQMFPDISHAVENRVDETCASCCCCARSPEPAGPAPAEEEEKICA